MAKSLPPVSAKVIADAEQFINEFRRADNAARRTTASIDGQVDKLAKSVGKRFSMAGVGTSILQGLGLGSGFAAAQTAADMLVKHFERAADIAKQIEQSTAKQLEITRQIIALRQSDSQKVLTLESDIERKTRELAAAQAQRFDKIYAVGSSNPEREVPRPHTEKEALEVTKIIEELKTLYLEKDKLAKSLSEPFKQAKDDVEAYYDEIEKINKLVAMGPANLGLTEDQGQAAMIAAGEKFFAGRIAEARKTQDTGIKALAEGIRQQEQAFDEMVKTQRDANVETERTRKENETLAEAFRQAVDPARQYQLEMENLYRVMALLSPEEVAANVERIKTAMVDAKLEDFFSEIDARSRMTGNSMEDLGNSAQMVGFMMGSAFEDAVLGGGELSDVINGLVSDIARMALQLAIVNPILNGIFGGTKGWSMLPSLFGGGKARGGAVDAGYTYRVNEDGQEFFRPNVGGTVMPVGASRGLSDSGGGGDSYSFTYNITAGVTHAELLPVLQAQEQRTISALRDAQRRRK